MNKNILLKDRGNDSSFLPFLLSEKTQISIEQSFKNNHLFEITFGHATHATHAAKTAKIQAGNTKELPTEGLLSGKIAAVLNIWVTLIGVLG